MEGSADIALVPVIVIPKLFDCRIITSYCIGANGPVASVMVYSQAPLQQIRKVYLDYQSLTSVNLIKVLANKYWNINFQWLKAEEGYEKKINDSTAGVIIGDRALEMRNEYSYHYDLAEEWKKFTGMPFTFACWVAHKSVTDETIAAFENALKKGLAETDNILEKYAGKLDKGFAREYLTKNISYHFDADKEKAMNLFLNHISYLNNRRIFA